MTLALTQTEPTASPYSPDPVTRLIGPIEASRLGELLPVVIPLLASSLAANGWKVGVEHLRGLLEKGGAELWVCMDIEKHELIAALITEMHEYPRAKVFSLAFCGGDEMHRWAPWIVALEDVAKSRGCTHVQIPGRKGWGRVFHGYEERHRVFEKPLERGTLWA